jgi:Fuseless
MEVEQKKVLAEQKRSLKDIFYALLLAFAIISFWRGVWGLMDLYLFPNYPVVSFSFSVLMGVIILFLTKNLIKKFL